MSETLVQCQLLCAVKDAYGDLEEVKHLLQIGGEVNYEYKNDGRSLYLKDEHEKKLII